MKGQRKEDGMTNKEMSDWRISQRQNENKRREFKSWETEQKETKITEAEGLRGIQDQKQK